MDTTFQCDSLFHPAASPTRPFCKTAFASRANEIGMAVARAGRAIDNLNEISPRGNKRKTCREVSALEDFREVSRELRASASAGGAGEEK